MDVIQVMIDTGRCKTVVCHKFVSILKNLSINLQSFTSYFGLLFRHFYDCT